MNSTTLSLAATAALFATGLASAQQPSRLEQLEADRINPNQITITFSYQGGVCEEVEPAELGEVVDGTLSVTFPTVSTAEICALQAVEIEVEQMVDAENTVSQVDVTLTAPDGTVIGTGSAEIDAN